MANTRKVGDVIEIRRAEEICRNEEQRPGRPSERERANQLPWGTIPGTKPAGVRGPDSGLEVDHHDGVGELARLMASGVRRETTPEGSKHVERSGEFGMSAENVSLPVEGSMITSSPPPNRTFRRNARPVPSGDHAGANFGLPGVEVSALKPVPSGRPRKSGGSGLGRAAGQGDQTAPGRRDSRRSGADPGGR